MVSLNARSGAVALILGSFGTAVIGLLAPDLVPLRLISFALALFGAWAFADEMGIRKPLNRAGLVAITFSGMANTLVLLNSDPATQAGYLLLYAFSLLFALLLWSIALLHRDRQVKVMGALGAAGAVLPILLLIAGHLAVGAGAVWGISSLYGASGAMAGKTPAVINIIEAVFCGWSTLAAYALWTGQITQSKNTLFPVRS